MDHYIILFNYLSNHLHFITNGFKHFSKTNSIDPWQRVPSNSRNYTNLLRILLIRVTIKQRLGVGQFVLHFQLDDLLLQGTDDVQLFRGLVVVGRRYGDVEGANADVRLLLQLFQLLLEFVSGHFGLAKEV